MASLEETVRKVGELEGLWRVAEKDRVLKVLDDQSYYLIAFRLRKLQVIVGLWHSAETPPLRLSQFVGIVDPTQKIQADRLVVSFETASESGPFDLSRLASELRARPKEVDAILADAVQKKREEALRDPDAFLNDVRSDEKEALSEGPVEKFPFVRVVSGGLPGLGKRR